MSLKIVAHSYHYYYFINISKKSNALWLLKPKKTESLAIILTAGD